MKVLGSIMEILERVINNEKGGKKPVELFEEVL